MEEAAEPETDYTTGTPWLYVDLEGNVTEETEADLKDNFALAANKEDLLKVLCQFAPPQTDPRIRHERQVP